MTFIFTIYKLLIEARFVTQALVKFILKHCNVFPHCFVKFTDVSALCVYNREMKVPKKESSSDEPTAAKQPKLSDKTEMETVTVKSSCQFEKFKSTLEVDWTCLSNKQLKKISHVYFLIRCKWMYYICAVRLVL